MEEQKPSIIKSALMPGLYLGIILIVYALLMYLLDVHRESAWNYLSFLWMAIGLFIAMTSIRDKTLGGSISYGQAFGAGFWTGFFAAIIGTIFTYFYFTYINPEIITEILLDSEEQMLEKYPNMSDEDIDNALVLTEKFTSGPVMTIFSFLMNLLSATVLSLIIAIFVKREETIEIVEEEVIEE